MFKFIFALTSVCAQALLPQNAVAEHPKLRTTTQQTVTDSTVVKTQTTVLPNPQRTVAS